MKIKIGVLALLISCSVLAIGLYFFLPTIRVVRTGYVMENYNAMIEATARLEEFDQQYKASLDSVKRVMNKVYQTKSSDSLKTHTLRRLQLEVNNRIRNYQAEKNNYDSQLTQGVLNQFNTLVNKYCEKNNIDILLGHMSGEGVLYAAGTWDVSDSLIESLNRDYEDQ